MARTRIQYLMPDGRFRMSFGDIRTQWANFLLNDRDSQAHALTEGPVAIEGHKKRCRTWDEFVNADPPSYPSEVGRQVVVCEQSAIFPISMEVVADPEDRQMQFKEAFEVGVQAAAGTAIVESAQDKMIGMASMLAMTVFLVAALVVVGMALNSGMGRDLLNNIPGMG